MWPHAAGALDWEPQSLGVAWDPRWGHDARGQQGESSSAAVTAMDGAAPPTAVPAEGQLQPPHAQTGATFLQGCGAKWDEPEHTVRPASYH